MSLSPARQRLNPPDRAWASPAHIPGSMPAAALDHEWHQDCLG